MAPPTLDPASPRGLTPNVTAELGVLIVEAPEVIRGLQLPLRTPEETIGRDGSVRLESAMVSRHHARVWAADGRVLIEDSGSANGTFVNGEQLTAPLPLVDGDRIRLGDVETVFHVGSGRRLDLSPGSSTAAFGWAIPPETVPHTHPVTTETTRYLCAAAHLNRSYREQVLDATVRETHRAVAPSYGVDLSMVARHAVLARRRALICEAVLAALLAAAIVAIVQWAVSVDVSKLIERQAWDLLAASAGDLLPVGATVLVAAWSAVAIEAWVRFATLGNYLRLGGRPEAAPMPGGARTAGLLAELAQANAGNVVVYSIYEPFVGSGVQVSRSSYPVPLIPQGGDPDATLRQRVEFRATELIAALNDALRTLSLKQLRIDRRLYVGGFDVAAFPELLPDRRRRPVTSAPSQLLDQLTEQPGGNVRPYLCAEVTGWHGQLVVTSFVRVVVLDGILFIETATYVLPPLRREYLAVDAMRIRTRGERLSETVRAAFAGCLPALLVSPMRLASAAGARRVAARREREFNRLLADKMRVDRGATASVRQQASGGQFYRYFMQLDAEMFASVVQEKVADTVAAFLEARGYRTDKINLIQNNISNTVNDNSMRVGDISGAGIAIGAGSRALATSGAGQGGIGGRGSVPGGAGSGGGIA
jgi:hypothetical protein